MIRRARAACGFTLIELVVVVAIMAILAVFMVFFLDTPVEAYLAQSRRAVLVDSADHVLRSVGADVRTALPSSLRWNSAGSIKAVEMLSITGVARYYGAGEKAGLALEELSIGSADTDFYTFGEDLATVNGPYLAIGTRTTMPGAYSFGNVMTPLPQAFAINAIGATSEDWVHFAGAGFDFVSPPTAPPLDSPTNSVFRVSGPVSYLCDTTQHTLQRYGGYAVTAAQPLTDAALMMAGATRGLIAQNVSACTVSIVPAPGSGAFDQLLILDVALASGGETLTVLVEAAPEYVP